MSRDRARSWSGTRSTHGSPIGVAFARILAGLTTTAVVLTGLSGCGGDGTDARVEAASVERSDPAADPATPGHDCVDELDTDALAGQLIIVLTDDATSAIGLIADGAVGGVALRSAQPADVTRQLAGVSAAARLPAFIASDEEGGTVQRLKSITGTYPSARQVAETMTPAQAGVRYEAFAKELVGAGVNVIFGPSLDAGTGSSLGSRTFSDDPATVSRYGTAIVAAAERAGALSVVKHWPGIGSGDADTHEQSATLAPIDTLRARDLTTFEAAFAQGATAVMVSHGRIPGLTGNDPASLSRAAITGELRGREHFDGLVITDSLGMGAVSAGATQDDAAERAIAAGADIALVSGGPAAAQAHERLTRAISGGRLDRAQVGESVRRILRAKRVDLATCRGAG